MKDPSGASRDLIRVLVADSNQTQSQLLSSAFAVSRACAWPAVAAKSPTACKRCGQLSSISCCWAMAPPITMP